MTLPRCTAEGSPTIRQALYDLGLGWAADPARPVLTARIVRTWDRLLDAWIADESLPLLIRKFRHNRGSMIRTAFGRTVVPTDNSPAQWAFAVAYQGECPKLSDVATLLRNGRIPIAMALSSGAEKNGAVYRGLRGRCPGTAEAGWKLAHITPVGLRGRGPLDGYGREALEQHFRLLMSPANMFVVPAAWAGLSEVDEFLAGFRAATAVGAGPCALLEPP